MKILMIGGTGFISSYTVRELLKDNHDVTVLTRGHSELEIFSREDVNFVIGDRNDKSFLSKLALENQYDVLIDMIAYLPKDSEMIVDVFSNKIPRLIHMSTVSVYMVSNEPKNPITEDQDKLPLMKYWDRNPFGMQYGIYKRKCEDILWEAHRDKKFDVTMVRAPYVCGIHDPMRRDHFWIERILDEQPLLIPGSGDYASQHVFVGDLARIFAKMVKNDLSIGKAYNIASEEIYSLNDYLDSLTRLLDKNPERINVDLKIFEQLSFCTSTEGHAFPYNTYRTAIFNLDLAKSELNFKSTPLDLWMPGVIDYYTNKFQGHSVGYSRRDEELEFLAVWKKEYQQFKNNLILS